jgi:hypothetical protein
MPVKYALRDAFGPVDLIQDTKLTFGGGDYDYRSYDAKDNVLAHEDSSTRTARMMAGMRYERGGKGKYWIPKVEHHHRTPLLGSSKARTMSPGVGHSSKSRDHSYGTADGGVDEPVLDAEEERLYDSARALEFGDWNVSRIRITAIALRRKLIWSTVPSHYCKYGRSRSNYTPKSDYCDCFDKSPRTTANRDTQEAQKEQNTKHSGRNGTKTSQA